ncbi:MAG: hypothetical protein GXO61_00900 [Epsilonproteobacteria bacterium]|nr:hypothetical protein [Campylobacterota bacterium]
MGYELRVTKDNSYTLYSTQYQECYHSVQDGALNEALKKHILPAFELVKKDKVKVLDICFGLGINSLATLYHLQHLNLKSLTLFSPELDLQLLKLLPNFSYPPSLQPYKEVLLTLLKKGEFEGTIHSTKVKLHLFKGDARQYIKTLPSIDIIYQDPFSPKKNPLLWTVEYFKDLNRILKGVLTTYSIASSIRLGLWEAGFYVYELNQQGVRKGTIASKSLLSHPNLTLLDMEKKKERATSKPLWDRDFV